MMADRVRERMTHADLCSALIPVANVLHFGNKNIHL